MRLFFAKGEFFKTHNRLHITLLRAKWRVVADEVPNQDIRIGDLDKRLITVAVLFAPLRIDHCRIVVERELVTNEGCNAFACCDG
jgi:hypothetical protein